MQQSILSLEVSSSNNPKVLRLFDTSHYCDDTALDNYIIEILTPFKTKWIDFFVTKGFSLALNSSNLHYKKVTNQSDLIALPDGIYEIKQSHKPNIFTLVHFLHFRVTELNNRLLKEKKELLDDKCSLSKEEYRKNLEKLRDIEDYISAAKYMVEECQDKKKGKELYDFAKELLENYSNECYC